MTEYAHTCTIIYIHIFTEVMYVLFVFYHIVAQQSKNLPVMQEKWRLEFDSWVGKIPCRSKWQPIPVSLPEEFHGQRSLADYGPEGCKESDTTGVT